MNQQWIRKFTVIGLTLAALQTHAAETTRIAVVNSDRILRDSAPARIALARLAQEFAPRNRALQQMAREMKTLSDKLDNKNTALAKNQRAYYQTKLARLNAEFQRKQQEFQRDLGQRRNRELAAILNQANWVIQQIAKREHYGVVLQEVVFADPELDITDTVLRELNKTKGPQRR